jgi:hypothetical protein
MIGVMKLPRFRLTAVLVVVTAVALVVGRTQARRRHLNREIRHLREEACFIPFRDHWLWPRAPERARVEFLKISADEFRFRIGGKSYTRADAHARYREMRSRLHELGVVDVKVVVSSFNGGIFDNWITEAYDPDQAGQIVIEQ